MRIRSSLRQIWLFGCLLAVVGCSACIAGPVRIVDYDFVTSASRTTSATEVALQTTNEGRADLIATDDMASFTLRVRPGEILVTIRNDGDQPLDLVLDEARHVDPAGKSRELYAAGSDRQSASPDRVEGGSPVTVFVWPRDWLRDSADGPGTWKGDSPLSGENTVGEARERKLRDVGQSFEILLPVEIGRTRHLYRFRFTVRKVRVEVILWA